MSGDKTTKSKILIHSRHIIASLSYAEIEAYFNVRLLGTSKLKKVKQAMSKMNQADLDKLAKAMGDEYKTELYWSNLEYHFDRIFIHGD